VTGPGTLGIIPDGTPGYPQYLPPLRFNNFVTDDPALNTFQPGNTYTWHWTGFRKVVGRHTLKFGGEFRREKVGTGRASGQLHPEVAILHHRRRQSCQFVLACVPANRLRDRIRRPGCSAGLE
jgi:hypothetical protein